VIWELYGGTELQALTFIRGDQWLTHAGSVGVVVAGEMKVLDDDGNECPPGVVGEIYMRPSRAARRLTATSVPPRKAATAGIRLATLATSTPDGFLYLNDRRVDMFTVGGRNVYPPKSSRRCRAPERVVVLGSWRPDDDMGQVPYAIVQADALDEAAVTAFLRERIAGYKVPRTVEFSETPLRDDAGKARRSAVRDEIIARRQAQARL